MLCNFPKTSQKNKCPPVKYTKIRKCLEQTGKMVDKPGMGCYTLAINLRNESIEARFARVCRPEWNGNSGRQKGYAAEVGIPYRGYLLGRRIISAGLSQNFCEALSMAIRFALGSVFSVFPWTALHAVHFLSPPEGNIFRNKQ